MAENSPWEYPKGSRRNLLSSGLAAPHRNRRAVSPSVPGSHRFGGKHRLSVRRLSLPVRICTLPRRSFAGIILVPAAGAVKTKKVREPYETVLQGRDAAPGAGRRPDGDLPGDHDGPGGGRRGGRGGEALPAHPGPAGGGALRQGQQRGRRLCLRRGALPAGGCVHRGAGPGGAPDRPGQRGLCPAARGNPLPKAAWGPAGGGAGRPPGGGPGGLRVRVQLPGGAAPGGRGAAGPVQPAGLPAGGRGPAQRGGVRHRPGRRGDLPGPGHGDLYRKKAGQLLLPRQGVLRGDGGAPGGGACRPGGGGPDQDVRAGRELPRAVAAPTGRAVQQGQPGEAAAGVRQLRHGGGLHHGGPGGPALRGGPGAGRRGEGAVPHPGPGGARGGVPHLGSGGRPRRLGAQAAGGPERLQRLPHWLRAGGAFGDLVPGGAGPL